MREYDLIAEWYASERVDEIGVNVWTAHKRIEKLRYIHRNPVKRGLVSAPELWVWSSFRWYAFGEPGMVKVNEAEAIRAQGVPFTHPSKTAKGGAPTARIV